MRGSDNVGYGYVVIPKDMGREEYITQCFESGSCAVFVKDFGVIPDMKIGMTVRNYIEFPYDYKEFGSIVAFMKTPQFNNHIIFEVVKGNRSIYDGDDSTATISKSYNNNKVSVVADSKNSSLIFDVSGADPRFVVNVTGDNQGTASAYIKVDGSVKSDADSFDITALKSFMLTLVSGDKTTKLTFSSGEVSIIDEFGNSIYINSKGVLISSDSINLGENKESAVLGDTLSDLIKDIVSGISAITVTTAIGVQPILNKATFESLKAKIDSIKSKTVKLK